MASYNYVRFVRGTPEAYAKIQKDNDTLYFIYEKNADDGLLYLGDKLICGGMSKNASLTNLIDVNIDEDLADQHILVYDEEKDIWVNKNASEAFQSLVNQIIKSYSNKVFRAKRQPGETDDDVIRRTREGLIIVTGDFIIIDINTPQQKNYVFDGTDWCLLNNSDSNFNIFDDSIFEETNDGKYTLKGFETAEKGSQPTKNEDGTISWVIPKRVSLDEVGDEIDEIQQKIEIIDKSINGYEGQEGFVEGLDQKVEKLENNQNNFITKAEVGDLNQLIHNVKNENGTDGTFVQEFNFISNLLTWQEL